MTFIVNIIYIYMYNLYIVIIYYICIMYMIGMYCKRDRMRFCTNDGGWRKLGLALSVARSPLSLLERAKDALCGAQSGDEVGHKQLLFQHQEAGASKCFHRKAFKRSNE